MKNFILLFSLMLINSAYSQNVISFNYDTAGNQTQRELICINCNPTGRKNIENITSDTDLIKSLEYNEISYYPNPVLETLYLKWLNNDGVVVESIEVYSLTGAIILSLSNLEKSNNTTIDFHSVSEGFYNVRVIYSNGKSKDLKIIKKN